MANLRTEITEIVTGLGMLGYQDLDHALGVRPRLVSHVNEEHFDRLQLARDEGRFEHEFETAWANGLLFAFSPEGLRGRPPWWVEWKGPHKPPAYEQIPADLRVDHVYLVSCKYGSDILMNASPGHLFDRLLNERRGSAATDWFNDVAPEAYQELWSLYRRDLSLTQLPELAGELEAGHRPSIKAAAQRGRSWPSEECGEAYRWLAVEVSNHSATRWLERVASERSGEEEMLWRLLRFAASPYFVLGAASDGTALHYRVATPWDFRQLFKLKSFDAWGDAVGQPLVRWRADVNDLQTGETRTVEGHIEVRWSHGRFGGMPEAKIYLDTPHHRVPGYLPLRTGARVEATAAQRPDLI